MERLTERNTRDIINLSWIREWFIMDKVTFKSRGVTMAEIIWSNNRSNKPFHQRYTLSGRPGEEGQNVLR